MKAPFDLIRLRRELCRLFPAQTDALMIATDIGLPLDHVRVDDTPAVRWHDILREAELHQLLGDLIERVRDDHPGLSTIFASVPPTPVHWPGGGYNVDHYVSRHQESQVLRMLSLDATPCWIQGPTSGGKTWLMRRVIEVVKQRNPGWHVAEVPTYLFAIETDDQFLLSLAYWLAAELGHGEEEVTKVWRSQVASTWKLSMMMESCLLPSIKLPIVMCFDLLEEEGLRPRWGSFVRVLRDWGQRHGEPWTKLRILVTSSTTSFHRDPKQVTSPWNVRPVRVGEFNASELRSLVAMSELSWGEREMRALTAALGRYSAPGRYFCYPCLARIAMSEVVLQQRLLKDVLLEGRNGVGAFKDYFERIRCWIVFYPEVRAVIKDVAEGKEVPESDARTIAEEAGLIVAVRVDEPDSFELCAPMYRRLAT